MGTIRIVLISKNRRKAASILSFFEMFIWIMAISNIMKNLDNPGCCIAYALGYSAGVYFGMVIEERISKGEFTPYFKKVSLLSRMVPGGFLSHRSQARELQLAGYSNPESSLEPNRN
jgi:hypothetical protein